MTRGADQPAAPSDTIPEPMIPGEQPGTALVQTSPRGIPALSANTLRAYATDWCTFCAWCEVSGIPPLPASPPVVARYLGVAAVSLGRSGVRRRLAAIAHAHRRAGQPWEGSHPAIADALNGIAAARGRPVRPAAVLTALEVGRLVDACGADPAGLRDRALLLMGFAASLRRSELVAIDREHLRFTPGGMSLLVGHGEHDGEGEEATVHIARAHDPMSCPVRAVEEWLRHARIGYGAVFRRISTGGALEGRLTPQGVWRVLRKRAGIARLTVHEGERLSPQGLRSGSSSRARPQSVRDVEPATGAPGRAPGP